MTDLEEANNIINSHIKECFWNGFMAGLFTGMAVVMTIFGILIEVGAI